MTIKRYKPSWNLDLIPPCTTQETSHVTTLKLSLSPGEGNSHSGSCMHWVITGVWDNDCQHLAEDWHGIGVQCIGAAANIRHQSVYHYYANYSVIVAMVIIGFIDNCLLWGSHPQCFAFSWCLLIFLVFEMYQFQSCRCFLGFITRVSSLPHLRWGKDQTIAIAAMNK
jgi:hypothetical protein